MKVSIKMFVELTNEYGQKVTVNSNYVEKFVSMPGGNNDAFYYSILTIVNGGPVITPPLRVRETYTELKEIFGVVENKKVINE